MREDGWWDPGASEIQAAIRSLRLRFTEISRTGTGRTLTWTWTETGTGTGAGILELVLVRC